MAIKQSSAKKVALPYLAGMQPGNVPRFYNPYHLCKVSTYMDIAARYGAKISLQALYARCRARTIPCVYIDGIPFVVLSIPIGEGGIPLRSEGTPFITTTP